MKYKVLDIGFQIPSKEVAIEVFRDALGLEPLASTSAEPMQYKIDNYTILALDLPSINPTYSTHLHLTTTKEQFTVILKKLQEVKGIKITTKEGQTFSGKAKKSVRIDFNDSDSRVLVTDVLDE